MASNFPSQLDILTNPSPEQSLDDPTVDHAAQHANANDAIEAIEAKIGIVGSADAASIENRLMSVTVSSGKPGGQTINGGTGNSETLSISSTGSGTKGKIFIGIQSVYDEVNGWLGIGTTTPLAQITNFVSTANITATVGSEILSSSGWTATGWTGDFSAGFTHTTGNTSVLSYPSFTAGSTLEYFYRLKFTISGRTAGSITITVGNVPKDLVTATGVLSFDTNSTLLKPVTFTPTTDFNGTISALQLSLVTKTQPLWATVDAAAKSDFEFRFQYFNSYSQAMGRNSIGFYTTTSGVQRNCGYGKEALYHLVEGTHNSAIGASCLFSLSKGDYNAAYGSPAGTALRLGNNNRVAPGAKPMISRNF